MSCLSIKSALLLGIFILGKKKNKTKKKRKETKLYFKNNPVSYEVQIQSSFIWDLHVNSLILPRAWFSQVNFP